MNIDVRLEKFSNKISRALFRISGKRPIVIHNHIFKNAGSTIDWALERNFGDAFVDHRDDVQMRAGEDYLRNYFTENKKIKALSSHHLFTPLPITDGIKWMSIIMLRDPIERVTSVYKFERAQLSETHPGVIHARKYNLRDYILWRMRPDVGATIRNFQSRKMLPSMWNSQEVISKGDMDILKKQLTKIEMLGLVSKFDESMVLFEEYLHKIFPKIDLSYITQNIGQASNASTEQRIEQLKKNIGSDTYELLMEKNREDLQLLKYAECEFASRLSRIKRFEEKLAEFRARCRAKMALDGGVV